jgi:hypothetical protein
MRKLTETEVQELEFAYELDLTHTYVYQTPNPKVVGCLDFRVTGDPRPELYDMETNVSTNGTRQWSHFDALFGSRQTWMSLMDQLDLIASELEAK